MEPSSRGLIGTGHLASHEIWRCMRGRGGGGNNRNCLGTRFVLRSNCFQNSYVKKPKHSEFSYYACALRFNLFLSFVSFNNPELISSLMFLATHLSAVCMAALVVTTTIHQPIVAETPRNIILW